MSFSFSYDLTVAEARLGVKLLSKHVYSGGWRVAAWAYSLFAGMSYVCAGFIFSFIFFNALLDDIESYVCIWYILALTAGFAMLLAERLLRRHAAKVYLQSGILKDQRIQISIDGISLDNGRSMQRVSWTDVDGLVEGSKMHVLCIGSTGIALPDRLLAEIGDPADLRAQTKAWFEQAREVSA